MAKIAEVLDIQRSYSNQVELRAEYFDLDVRTDRMAHYKPIRAHRAAFEKIAEGIWQQNNKRSYIISGSFGTGKSHLLMMLASYFSTPSTTSEMKKFFENYDQAEKDENVKNPKATQLKNLRSEGQFLVSICDYASPDFETNLLRAIRETLELEGLDMDSMESAYSQAIDKINEWKESGNSYFIDKLEELLESTASKWSVDSLVSDMRDFNVDALNEFKTLYKQITSTDFQYDKDNYVKVISALTDVNTTIRKKYKGWVILFDEFDYQIGEKRFHLEQFQQLLQKCSKSLLDGFPILFVATIHKSFLEYKSVYNAADFSTLSDRFDEIKLESEGIEDIISAVVNPKKDSDIWKSEIGIQQSKMVQLANETNKHHLFDWLRAAQIKGKIIENIYPMHPAATYALIKLAGAAGSNNRSVVSFFAQEAEEPGSYAEYINHTDILTNGDLNVYTVDLLCSYFSLSSASENITDVAREHIRNYETSLRELYKIRHNSMDDLVLSQDIFEQVLKVMVIYDIIGLPNTFDMIAFGLNKGTPSQKSSLESVFKKACEKRIIYLNDTNGCYEFKRSDSKDISGLIRDYKSKPANIPENYVLTLNEISRNDYAVKVRKKLKDDALAPQKYNLQWMEDKRLQKVFCMLKDLEDQEYFTRLHDALASETDIKKSFDGAVVYVICEKPEELAAAVVSAKENIYPEIMVAVSNDPADICDDIFSLKAACSYQEKSEDFSTQDLMALKTQAQAYDMKIAKRLDYLTDSRNYRAYTVGGALLEKGANDAAAVELLEKLYSGKRNTVKNEELNKSHEFKDNNTALRDAADRLLDISQPVSFHNDYGSDRGDIKFIRNVLVQCGVIYKSNAQGSVEYCYVEKDVSKYSKFLPGLSAMITEIHDSDGTEINIQKFIHRYMKEYGLGYNAVLLFMAVVKRYFTDSLTIVKDVAAVGSINVNNMDILKSIVISPQYVNCVMKYEPISEAEEKYIEKLITIFGGTSAGNLDVLQQLMETWYDGLDPICKVEELYPDENTETFVKICNQIKAMPIREICLYEFKSIIGMERDTLIYGSIGDDLAEAIKTQKGNVENGFYIARKKILSGISELFGQKSEDISAIEKEFNNWVKDLDEAQRDVLNPLQNDYSKPIVKAIGSDEPFSDILFKNIPADMKLGEVRKWTSDHCAEYVQTFGQGKRHIEEDVYAVSCPVYTLDGREVEEEKNGKNAEIRFSGELIINLDKGEDNVCYYVSTDGNDPQDPKAQRIKRMEAYALKITKDTKVRFCGESEAHKFSSVLTLNCVNEEMKYEAKLAPGQQYQEIRDGEFKTVKDIKINGIVPVDAGSLQLFVTSLAGLMEESQNVDRKEILRGLNNAIHDLEA